MPFYIGLIDCDYPQVGLQLLREANRASVDIPVIVQTHTCSAKFMLVKDVVLVKHVTISVILNNNLTRDFLR